MPHEPISKGLNYVQQIYDLLQVDEEWAIWDEYGFTWWPYRHAQRVSVASLGIWEQEELYRLTVESDFLIDESGGKLEPFWDAISTMASMYGMVREEETGLIRLTTSAVIYDSISAWLLKLFGAAAYLQLSQGEDDPESLEVEGTKLATSSHPINGDRETPDEMVFAAQLPVPPGGLGWSASSEFEQMAESLSEEGIFSTGSKGGLTAEVPIGPDGGPALLRGTSALITASTDAPNPNLGPGLLTLLRFPPSKKLRPLRPLELNRLNLDGENSENSGNLFGSWCSDSETKGETFVSFFPDAFYRPGLVSNIIYWYVAKAVWAEQLFLDG